MNKVEFLTKVNRKVARMKINGRKYSPEILIAIGVVGSITGMALACVATTKLDSVKEKKDIAMDEIHARYNPETELDVIKKETTAVYARTGLRYAALYSPAIIVEGISLSCMVASNIIMRKRIVGVTAAYATLATSFKEYRGRVTERYGEDVEYEIRHNIRNEEITTTKVDKHGNEKTKTEKVKTIDTSKLSDYSRIYDSGCNGWSKDPIANRTFLRCQETAANQRLERDETVTLNDVYEMLGFQRTPEGQVVGWHFNPDAPVGERQIDFGIFTGLEESEAKRRFINGLECNVILDFNVQGNILEYI